MKLKMVGVAGLEPATFRPPAERATRLRHTPNVDLINPAWFGPTSVCILRVHAGLIAELLNHQLPMQKLH